MSQYIYDNRIKASNLSVGKMSVSVSISSKKLRLVYSSHDYDMKIGHTNASD